MTALTKRMNCTTRKRFEEVWRLTNFFEPQKFELKKPMRCPAEDAELAMNGIAVPPSKPKPTQQGPADDPFNGPRASTTCAITLGIRLRSI